MCAIDARQLNYSNASIADEVCIFHCCEPATENCENGREQKNDRKRIGLLNAEDVFANGQREQQHDNAKCGRRDRIFDFCRAVLMFGDHDVQFITAVALPQETRGCQFVSICN